MEHSDPFASLRGAGVRTVFHCAGRSFVPASWKDPQSFYRINTLGTQRVLEYCHTEKARLIYVSTYVYGQPRYLPIDEAHPAQPLNPYTHSKWLGEEICRFYQDHMGVEVTILRPFNIYGPGQSEQFLVAQLVRQWQSGADIVVTDPAPRRDYIYIDDFVDACAVVARLEHPAPIYNVGSGRSLSVAEVLALLGEAVGAPIAWRSRGEPRQGEIANVVASCALVRENLWKPRVDFQEGLRKMVVG